MRRLAEKPGVRRLSEEYYNETFHLFPDALVEFYYYKNPQVKKIAPTSGLTSGGTKIEIAGAWFDLKPEYAYIPHCKIGDKVVRATFYSTVRIVCVAPPNDNYWQAQPVYVS